MIDPTQNEKMAMEKGGELAGEYLESIKKTDLADFTGEEYAMFVQCVVTGYIDELQNLAFKELNKVKS